MGHPLLFAIYGHVETVFPRRVQPNFCRVSLFENVARAKCSAIANWISVTLLLHRVSAPPSIRSSLSLVYLVPPFP